MIPLSKYTISLTGLLLFMFGTAAIAQIEVVNTTVTSGSTTASSANFQATFTTGQPTTGVVIGASISAFTGFSDVYSVVSTSQVVIAVEIDIKPGSDDNSINLGSNGNVPVAIFGSESFDATSVVPSTVTLANAAIKLKGNGTPITSFDDVNDDGYLDVIVHIEASVLELSETSTQAVLEGETIEGRHIRGVDSIVVVPLAAPGASVGIPTETRVLPPFPSPSNPEVWIPYRLHTGSTVVINIYDISGRLVRRLDIGYQVPGIYESKTKAVYWDGRNARGETVASGLYFCELVMDDFSATQKLLIAR